MLLSSGSNSGVYVFPDSLCSATIVLFSREEGRAFVTWRVVTRLGSLV